MDKKVRLFLYDRDKGEFFNSVAREDFESYAYFDTLGEAYAYLKDAISGFDLNESDLVAEIDFI